MNKNVTLEYLGYKATVDSDVCGDVLVGSVVGTKSKITFVAPTFGQLRREMKRSVDGYLNLCKQKGVAPDQPQA
jgi:predicted HicB family RNase H-like nuclease